MEVTGFEYRIRETAFGVTCLLRSTEAQPLFLTWNREGGGGVRSAVLGGTITSDCGIAGQFGGTSSTFSAETITLI